MGWGVLRMPFAPEPFVTHTGSNTMNLAMIFLQPARDWAMVLATNIAGRRADATLRELAAALYARFA